MRRRFPPWLLLLLLLGIFVATLAGVIVWRGRMHSTARLLERIPDGSNVLVHIDFEALRNAGLLESFGGPEAVREPEYRAFVEQTGFDYTRDLDAALVAFHPRGTYFVLRGRFNWKLLKEYVLAQGGLCFNAFCRTQGSTPQRMISYFPIHSTIMGLAVGPDDWAASQLQTRRPQPLKSVPSTPIWAVVSRSALRNPGSMPVGTRAFARLLEDADRLLFTVSPDVRGNIHARMEVACPSPQSAAQLSGKLRETTDTLRDLIRKEGQAPNPADLSGVLTSGSFQADGARVVGDWPLPRAFLESLMGGTP